MEKEIKNLASISFKDLGFTAKEIRKLVEDKKEAVFIARVGGVAMEFFNGESKHGEYTGFKGLFFAITKDGEEYQSKTIFLPSNISRKLREQME